MNAKKLTYSGFKRAFHAARRRYWHARARLDKERAIGAEEAACRLAHVAMFAGMLSEAQEVQVSLMTVDLDRWLHVEGF